MSDRVVSGPLLTTIFIIVSLAAVLVFFYEAHVAAGPGWYTALVAFLVAVAVLFAIFLAAGVNGGRA